MSDIQNTYEICVDIYGPGGTGIPGPRGYQGDVGFNGVNGAQGPQGVQGFIGNIGTQGRQGSVGTGTQGPQGRQGFQGVVGAVGPQGFQGRQGFQGSGTQGFQGRQGFQGSSSGQFNFGVASVNFDFLNSGRASITHGLGSTPTSIFCTDASATHIGGSGNVLIIGVESANSTTFTIVASDFDTAVFTGGRNVYWMAIK